MLDLSFLKDVTIQEVERTRATKGGNNYPSSGDMKVHRSGKLFFSESLRTKLSDVSGFQEEEFVKGVTEKGTLAYGIDVVDSRKWNLYPKNASQDLVFVCLTPLVNPKLSAKVDIRQESVNAKIAAVEKSLIPMLQEIYGISTDFSSVELEIKWDMPLTNEKGIYQIPKVISGGERAGEDTYVRRENVTFYPLVPVVSDNATTVEEVVEATVEVEDAQTEINWPKEVQSEDNN